MIRVLLTAILICVLPFQAHALGDNEKLALSFFVGKWYGERHYRQPHGFRHYNNHGYYQVPPQQYHYYEHRPQMVPSYSTPHGTYCPPGYGLVMKQQGGYMTNVGCRRYWSF